VRPRPLAAVPLKRRELHTGEYHIAPPAWLRLGEPLVRVQVTCGDPDPVKPRLPTTTTRQAGRDIPYQGSLRPRGKPAMSDDSPAVTFGI
jgi:hypothetical protein